jgi:hypothetical protein
MDMNASTSLIDQLCKAIEDWRQYSGREAEAHFFIMVWTGGSFHMRPEGAIDPSTVPIEERKKLTHGQVSGRYGIEQVRKWLRKWLTYLVRKVGIFEEFLVIALIKDVRRTP